MELSVVVAILSVLATLGLEVAASFVNRSATSVTRERLKVVDEALVQYFRVYGRLPSPSGTTTAPTSNVYGLEATAQTIVNSAGIGNGVYVGAIPFRTLNLPMSYSLDGFGNKLNYAVTINLTAAGGGTAAGSDYRFASSGFALPKQNGIAGIEVRTGELEQPCSTAKCSVVADPAAGTGAAYFIFSSGADQRGAYSARGVAKSPCATTTANSDKRPDAQNCVFGDATTRGYLSAWNGASWVASTIPDNVFYDNRYNPGLNLTSYFDDVAIWRTKGQL